MAPPPLQLSKTKISPPVTTGAQVGCTEAMSEVPKRIEFKTTSI